MRTSLLTTFVVVIALLDSGARGAELNGTATIKGRCTKLILADQVVRGCQGILLNTSYADGRSGFYFVSGDTIVTFTGAGSRQIMQGPDKVAQPIDQVITSIKGKPRQAKAVGSCRFGNPYKGAVTIECRADTQQGRYEGDFTTDGLPPNVTKF